MFFPGTKALGIERICYDTKRECTTLSSCETVGALATKPSNWGIVKWCGCQLKGLGNLALTVSSLLGKGTVSSLAWDSGTILFW